MVLEEGWIRTWENLTFEGKRAIQRRFEQFFVDSKNSRVRSYKLCWFQYYRYVIGRREVSEPLFGAYDYLDSELRGEFFLKVDNFSSIELGACGFYLVNLFLS